MLEILLVDDDELMRQSLTLLLGHEGFRVQAAPGGPEALELARQQAYDLVISDVRMPGMDGFAVVRSLRELLPEAHFILMTGFSSEEAPIEALRLGVDDYFHKPFDLNVFLERIRVMRRQKRQQKTQAPEQALRSFAGWLRRHPGFAEKFEALEQQVGRAAQRLGLDSSKQQALRLAVYFHDLVAHLPPFPDVPLRSGPSVAEQAAQLLVRAGTRPVSDDLAVQLLLGVIRQQNPQMKSPPELPGKIWEELGAAPRLEEAPVRGHGLKVHTFGQTRVIQENQEIQATQWESQRARWLFVYLLTRRGQWVSGDRLRDLFWPESDGDKAQRSLVSTIHRCRKALGSSGHVLQRSDRGYAVSCGSDLWWDFDEFERCCRESTGGGDAEDALLRAEAVYRGELAPDCPYEWLEPLRQQARTMALDAFVRLAGLLLESNPEAAEIRAYKALEIESTSESAAEVLLRSLWAQGKRDEGVRFYQEFRQRLERELGLPPGPKLLRAQLELTQIG